MKKRTFILILFALLFLGGLTSCDLMGSNGYDSSKSDYDNQKKDDDLDGNKDNPKGQGKVFDPKDNSLSPTAFNEFLNFYPNLTYDEFLSSASINYTSSASFSNISTQTIFNYKDASLQIDSNGTVTAKSIITKNDNNVPIRKYYQIFNNEWLETEESIVVYSENSVNYYITMWINLLGSDFIDFKEEITYDDNFN